MSSYQRVHTAVRHCQPDRVPCDYLAVTEVTDTLCTHFNVDSYDDLLDILQIDRRTVSPTYIGPQLKQFDDGSYETIVSGGPVMKDFILPNGTKSPATVHYPWSNIETPEDLQDRVGWSGDLDWWDFSGIKDQIDALQQKGDYWIAAHGDPSGLQHLCMWVGDEKFLMILAIEPDLAFAMIEQHNRFRLEHALKSLEAGGGRIHELHGGGDYGTQNGLLISKEMFRKFFKRLYVDFYTEIRKHFEVEIFFHCCGAIVELIPELIEIGVTILDPIQVSAHSMNIEYLKNRFGDRLTFHGGIDIQQLLPYGTIRQVKSEVRRTIDILGRDGGYILAPTHCLQPDTPVENILAMYEEVQNRKFD